MKSQLELWLENELSSAGLVFEREYRFHPKRRWRFDFADPERMLAIEVEGGQYVQGRHQRPEGFAGDLDKYNEAALMGWTVLRFTGKMMFDGVAMETIRRALEEDRPG